LINFIPQAIENQVRSLVCDRTKRNKQTLDAAFTKSLEN